ncbi:HTH_Tnp_Tc3_2 domain-containing protein [Trichonephila clavipes]|nr:HTH_Tnp_Tc3_2 domain-containing protein [Trichonephila clavipes]
MSHVRSRNAYQHEFHFDTGQIVSYRNSGLSYRSIAACVGRDPMTVSRIWNRRVRDGNKERLAGSQRPPINRKDRHVTRMALTDCAITSRALSQELGFVCKTTTVCTNSSTTFAVALTLSSETMVAATLVAASQTGASLMV